MSATEGAVPLGVVIPTLDEEDALPHLLDDLATLPIDHRVLVVDGGSRDGTEALVRRYGHGWLRTEAGRARQMNAGARALSTPWILFLHADSRLPAASATALVAWIARHPQGGAAHFRFRLDRRGPWWWLLERGQRLRERLSGRILPTLI